MTTTRERIDEGIAHINALPDDCVGTFKEHARGLLSEVLGEDIPTRPLRRAERLDLLIRARQKVTW